MDNELHSTPELEQICKDLRGVEFLYNNEPAYVAAASPLVGLTVRPLEPDEEFLARPREYQYCYCLHAAHAETQAKLEAAFMRVHQALVGATPETSLNFEKLCGELPHLYSSSCPFS